MIAGIDVGGTHTDAVLLRNGELVCVFKAPTDHDNLLVSVLKALDGVCADIDPSKIRSVALSTTLSTNAIIENKTEPTGVIVSAGPGIDPENFRFGENYHVVKGAIDHRGEIVCPLDSDALKSVVEEMKKQGLKVFACASKFSTRNPSHEEEMVSALKSISDFCTLGSSLSGRLSFPRRIATADLNSSVWRVYKTFSEAVKVALEKRGIKASVYVLKADGGTMAFDRSVSIPVQTILSGPAASVLGALALGEISCDAIALDVGGTTTDIAFYAKGVPLVDRDGISLAGRPTLVRSLLTTSIGIGGDSALTYYKNTLQVGPQRKGPSLAAGGECPALIDCMNMMELSSFGEIERSVKGITAFAKSIDMDPESLCKEALDQASDRIINAINKMKKELSDRPVYTIHEMLMGRDLKPEMMVIIGGPAEAIGRLLGGRVDIPVVVPENSGTANALGAALARETLEIEIHADTERGEMIIPELGIRDLIDPDYSADIAVIDARELLSRHISTEDEPVQPDEIEITECSEFNMVKGFYTVGKDIRVVAQRKPGIRKGYERN